MKKKINLKIKDKKLVVVVLVVSVLVLICLISSIFKSNKEKFLSYLLGMESNYKTEKIEKNLSEYLNKKDTTVYANKGNSTVNVAGLDNEQLKLSNLNKSSITFEGKTDPNEEISQQSMTINYDKGNVVPVEFRRKNDVYAIQANSSEAQYIGLRNDNLQALANLLGLDVENIPDKIMTDNIQFTEKELNKLSKKYYKILKNNLDNKSFSKEKSGDQTIFKFSSKQEKAINALLKVLEELREDEIILEKIKIESRSQLERTIEDIKRTLEQQQDTSGKDNIEINLYIKDNKVTKCEVSVFEYEEVRYKAIIEMTKDNTSIKVYDREELLMKLTFKTEKTENDITKKVSFKWTEEYGKDIEFEISMLYKNVLEMDNVEENTTLKLVLISNEYEIEGEKKEINLQTSNKITFTPDEDVDRFEEYDETIINELSHEELPIVLQTLYNSLGLI